MYKEYLENPLNKRKGIHKFYLRQFENFIKNSILYLLILPFIFPILLINLLKKNKFLFKDFFNQNGVVYIVSCLKNRENTVFLFKFFDFHKIFNRFGLLYLIKNFSLYLGIQNAKEISFIDKNSDYYFNKDYFYFFDKKLSENTNNFVLPFYLTKNFYIQKKIKNDKSLIKLEKKFKIVFSGTTHNDWYKKFRFRNSENKEFLNRTKILQIIKENFSEKTLVVENKSQVNEIENSDKEIILVETNPEIHNRKKMFSENRHLELISNSKFFLCMPGASMPLCYHLIESCLVGTVPILSYNEYLHPKLTKDDALFFFTENELIKTIENALALENDKYLIMQKNILKYYEKFLSPSGVYESLSKKNHPIEIFTNLDHTSSRLRADRLL